MSSFFEFYPLKNMNDPDEWLLLTLGDDEAAQAMSLPSELRRVIYSDVYTYGPAAPRVLELADCLTKAPPTDDVWMRLGQVYGVMDKRAEQVWSKWGNVATTGTPQSLQALMGRWGKELSEVKRLQSYFNSLCGNLGVSPSVGPLSGPMVMMFLTGEYLFPTHFNGVNFLEAMREATPSMNRVLLALNLEPISGRLANPNPSSETLSV